MGFSWSWGGVLNFHSYAEPTRETRAHQRRMFERSSVSRISW